MDIVQVVRPGQEPIRLEVTEYTDVARGPGEAPPLFVRAFIGPNSATSYYNNFVPRGGDLVIPEVPGVRFTLRGDIAPILEVAKDPELGWVLFWFGLMAAGFALSLYVTFSRCWVCITRRADLPPGCDVMLGGLTERNKVSFERDFERLALRARDRLAAQVAAG